MIKHYELAIIGAGPIGLIAAKIASDQNYQTLIIESRPHVGGQVTELYPKKEVEDLIGLPVILGEQYIELLMNDLTFNDHLELALNTEVTNLESNDTGVVIKTSNGDYTADNVIVATGLGVYKPRPLGVENEDKYQEILYALKDYDFLANKKVLVMGGGDSAIDWAKMVSYVSDDVSLIHRRKEFRGDLSTIENVKTIKIFTPYIPLQILTTAGHLSGLRVENVETKEQLDLPADYILVNYGNIPRGDTFGLEKHRLGIKVDENFLAAPHIYVAGDVASYEGKKKRIIPGMEELDSIFASLKKN